MVGFDLSTISSVYVGNTQYSEIYYGSTKIWSSSPDYSREYFTIESLENSNEIYLIAVGGISGTTVDVSTDNGSTWISKTSSASPGTLLATLNIGDKLLMKGSNTSYATATNKYNRLNSTKTYNVYGNIMSLIYGDNFIGQTSLSSNYTFVSLFSSSKIVSSEHLILPATTLLASCYYRMFIDCTSLITPPELPATTLANNCYNGMFTRCSSLTTAPELPATTVRGSSYQYMFANCTSLTTAPELPATTLNYASYQRMFEGCTSLRTAPVLPATTLTNYCYNGMFNGCTSLNSITCHATNISASSCLTDWLYGVARTGDFYKDANTTYPTSASGIPSGWTIHNIN